MCGILSVESPQVQGRLPTFAPHVLLSEREGDGWGVRQAGRRGRAWGGDRLERGAREIVRYRPHVTALGASAPDLLYAAHGVIPAAVSCA